MNALENYRIQQGLTYESLGQLVGLKKVTIWRHCTGVSLPDVKAVALYMQILGLSFEKIRPDLWPHFNQK